MFNRSSLHTETLAKRTRLVAAICLVSDASTITASTVACSHLGAMEIAQLWQDLEKTASSTRSLHILRGHGQWYYIPRRRCWYTDGDYNGLGHHVAAGMVQIQQGFLFLRPPRVRHARDRAAAVAISWSHRPPRRWRISILSHRNSVSRYMIVSRLHLA